MRCLRFWGNEKRIDDAKELCYFLDVMRKEHAQKEKNKHRKEETTMRIKNVVMLGIAGVVFTSTVLGG